MSRVAFVHAINIVGNLSATSLAMSCSLRWVFSSVDVSANKLATLQRSTRMNIVSTETLVYKTPDAMNAFSRYSLEDTPGEKTRAIMASRIGYHQRSCSPLCASRTRHTRSAGTASRHHASSPLLDRLLECAAQQVGAQWWHRSLARRRTERYGRKVSDSNMNACVTWKTYETLTGNSQQTSTRIRRASDVPVIRASVYDSMKRALV